MHGYCKLFSKPGADVILETLEYFNFICAGSSRQLMIYCVSHLPFAMIMYTNLLHRCVLALVLALAISSVRASDDPLFHSTDPLAPRDEWGVLHQTPTLYPTDFSTGTAIAFTIIFIPEKELLADPAYVGALQVSLRNRGYYCGPIDGIMSDEVSDAIAHLQKNHTQRVTGRLTVPVRRALHLP